jgi:hypothetical protein
VRIFAELTTKRIVVIVVIALTLAVAGAVAAFSLIKSNDAYRLGLAKATKHPEVIQELGEPIHPGVFVTGRVSTAGPSGSADLAVPLVGTHAEGTLYIVAVKSADRWQFKTLEVAVKGKPDRINLLANAGVQ